MDNKKLKTVLAAVFLVTAAFIPAFSKQSKQIMKIPDFAFPQNVEKDARAHLEKALKDGDAVSALRAYMDLEIATTRISREQTPGLLAELDSICLGFDEPYSAVGYLLEALIYSEIYRSESWNFDRRVVEEGMADKNPMLWDRKLFASKINSLLMLALSEKKAAAATPLSRIAPLVTCNEPIGSFTVYDFIVYKAIELNGIFRQEQTIPFFKSSTNLIQPLVLADELEALHPSPSPACTAAILTKANLLPEGEETAYLREQIRRLKGSPEVLPLVTRYAQALGVSSNRYYATPAVDRNLTPAKEFYMLVDSLKNCVSDRKAVSDLNQILNNLSAESVILEYPDRVMPGKEIDVLATANNISEYYVLLLDVRDKELNNYTRSEISRKTVRVDYSKVSNIGASEALPYEIKTIVKFNIPKPGRYVVVASRTPDPKDIIESSDRFYISTFTASQIDMISLCEATPDDNDTVSSYLPHGCFVVDAENGSPVDGASVRFVEQLSYYDQKRRPALEEKVVTDDEGFAGSTIQNANAYCEYEGSNASSYVNRYRQYIQGKETRIRFFLDQAVYRPGEKVNFMGLLYETNENSGRILSGKDIMIILKNANSEAVDSLRLRSDVSGRVSGAFTLPTDGLLGSWKLAASEGTAYFEVAEYKTPTIIVSMEQVSSSSDSVVFEGKAATYSGLPLAEARVQYKVDYVPLRFWYRRFQYPASFSSETETDADGNFRISLPLDNLDTNQYRGLFTVVASVTDAAGETADSPVRNFWISDTFNISPAIPSELKVDGTELTLNVPVKDTAEMPAIKSVEYSVKDDAGVIVAEGVFESPVLKLDVASIKSGRYIFSFGLKEGDAHPCTATTVLYRDSDLEPPVDTCLWIPQTKYIAPKGEETVKIRLGSSFAGQYILCIESDTKGNADFHWLRSDGRNTEIEFTTPAADERKFIRFLACRDHHILSQEVNIIPAEQEERLEIVTETFRSSLQPGASEEWKFTLKYRGRPVKGNACALLYDKAMDAIMPLSWPSTLFTPTYPVWTRISYTSAGQFSCTFNSKSESMPYYPDLDLGFETYGYQLFGRGTRMIMARLASQKQMSDNNELVYEDADEATYDMAAPTGAYNLAIAEESVESQETGVGPETPSEGSVFADEESFRPVEMPVAFFKPDLTSDTDGNVAIAFTVPDFNTTWNFIMMAYTPELAGDNIRLETVAAKKVMVKMLPPRFLRTGDRATVTATVFNNSDQDCMITGVFEIFNPATGEVLERVSDADFSLAPSRSRVVSTDFDCPSDLNAVGLRVFARANGASDGEQTVIPVLPSSQPVVESDPFYLTPGQEEFSFRIPEAKDGARLTFKYCDNPIWEALTALPPIISPDSEALTSQIRALYANCVGLGVMENSPSLKRGLQLIIAGEAGDSLLISNLEKDQDLKTVLLGNTPWVNDARSETLRLSKLGSLLDIRQGNKTVLDSWKKIVALRNSDGGWSWCKDMRSSRWMTEIFLINIGLLKAGGYLPELPGCNQYVKEAIGFVEREYVADYGNIKGDKSGFLLSMLPYLYTRSFFPEVSSSSAMKRIHREALDVIDKNWETMSIYEMGTAAITLWRNDRKMTAREILESLRQHTVQTPEKGAWFDNLDSGWRGGGKQLTTARVLMAFHEIQPSDTLVDKMRQWLLLQRQTQDFNEGLWSIDAIDALLTTGSEWAGDYEAPQIRIASTQLPVSEVSRLTGQVTADVSLKDANRGVIEIRRFAPGPAWGGVISQYVAPMEEIVADAIPDLSIQKEFWRIDESPEGVRAVKTETFKIGDKVRVTMIIDCGRDMDFVALTDQRPACVEPAQQLSGYTCRDGLWLYQETRNSSTNLFFDFLPKGRHIISYECRVMEAGEFASGVAILQCLYSPLLTAHSAGQMIVVE